jgi:hypothetical protein
MWWAVVHCLYFMAGFTVIVPVLNMMIIIDENNANVYWEPPMAHTLY